MQAQTLIAESHSSIINPDNTECRLCAELSRAYSSGRSQDSACPSGAEITGEYIRVSSDDLELSIIDMTVHDNIRLSSGQNRRNKRINITCCLDGGMQWQQHPAQTEISLFKGHMLLSSTPSGGMCQMSRGQRIRCVDIAAEPGEALSNLCWTDALPSHPIPMSPRVNSVVADILDSRPHEAFRQVYFEGKAKELLALVLDEALNAEQAQRVARLSSDCIERLRQAKNLLDADIANAPTLPTLSRLVCLNEHKLKTGFKILFGQPVHAYIIDRRLETARRLLERGNLSVTEAAHHVGYTELGRFAGIFRKKYGIPPSYLLKRPHNSVAGAS